MLSSWLRKLKPFDQLWRTILWRLSRGIQPPLKTLEDRTLPARTDRAQPTYWLIGVLLALGIALCIVDALWAWQLGRDECAASRAALHLQQDLQERQLYSDQIARLASEVAQRQTTLPAAAAELAGFLEQRHFDPLVVLRSRFTGLSDEACLAIVLLRHVAASLPDEDEARKEILTTCVREFEEHCGHALPSHAWGEDSGCLG